MQHIVDLHRLIHCVVRYLGWVTVFHTLLVITQTTNDTGENIFIACQIYSFTAVVNHFLTNFDDATFIRQRVCVFQLNDA